MNNAAIARILAEIADLLELKGENPLKIRAYRNAADTVTHASGRVADLAEAELLKLPGICQVDRLDLGDVHARLAREHGATLVIGTDAHSARGLGLLRWGVLVARRGGLEAGDVLNTRPAEAFRAALRRNRGRSGR